MNKMGYEMLSSDGSSKRQRRQYRPNVSLSILTVLLIMLGLQFIILPGYLYQYSPAEAQFSLFNFDRLDAKLQHCAEINAPFVKYPLTTAGSRTNPRWNAITGQEGTTVLKNATLFDGATFLSGGVDVTFKKGIIESVKPAGQTSFFGAATVVDVEGRYVTPGLVDMHSHHMAIAWPILETTSDGNEFSMGPLTPQLRILDSLKAYDIATEIIASGGVTTSLILPGSANIMGGEAVVVKNAFKSGKNKEFVVEDVLLEHGIPKSERRRYMKMACGENPAGLYKHARMGNAWELRKHMERAKELKQKQDAMCYEAAFQRERGDPVAIAKFLDASDKAVTAAELLEFDSSIAMLRGKAGINVHCYEPEDMEDMLLHSKEFGFRIQAFHHALEAWQVPEMLKANGENVTIATFSELGFYKKEAYDANLWAGSILAHHGVPVAYKSDHVTAETSAKYLLFQAATAHSFHLPEDLALQSVTSVPAKSMEIDHRVGYAKAGYDADLVVWDSHPLSVGATALQVYIDGRPILDPKKVNESLTVSSSRVRRDEKPAMRKLPDASEREQTCSSIEKSGSKLLITGIKASFLDGSPEVSSPSNLTMLVDNGNILCFDTYNVCVRKSDHYHTIHLENGYVLPGLKAVSVSLGLYDIADDDTTGDGTIDKSTSFKSGDVVYAKYGIRLEGRGFARARLGGVTKAITAPAAEGFVGGVSVGIKTSGKKTVLNGGIFQEEVALHFSIGQDSRGSKSIPTVSAGISKLRRLLIENMEKDNIYGRAANGTFPLVVHAENEYDISQLIKIKQQYPHLKLVILGGSGAHLVATELAAAKVPLILTANRGAPETWEKLNALPGPPLSRSPAAVLSDAGVKFGLAIGGEGDSHIHNIPIEASWAAKYAGLSDKQAVDLVSRNIEDILELENDHKPDLVVWEGNPLEFGASVVVMLDGESVAMCWPQSN